MKEGEYFWIEVPNDEKDKFKEGKDIMLSKNDLRKYPVSKDLSE